MMHELMRKWMGVSDRIKARGGGAAAAAGGDGQSEAMFKERLTSGYVRLREMFRNEQTGDREEREIVRPSNGLTY